jgi:hypothetical protein
MVISKAGHVVHKLESYSQFYISYSHVSVSCSLVWFFIFEIDPFRNLLVTRNAYKVLVIVLILELYRPNQTLADP